jgi:hypothetical protein
MKAKGKLWWGNTGSAEVQWKSSLDLHLSAEQHIVIHAFGIEFC